MGRSVAVVAKEGMVSAFSYRPTLKYAPSCLDSGFAKVLNFVLHF